MKKVVTPFHIGESMPVDPDMLTQLGPAAIDQLFDRILGSKPASKSINQRRRMLARELQMRNHGGLPESARQYALAIARNSQRRIRRTPIQHASNNVTVAHINSGHDPRIPMPGSILLKNYRGQRLHVRVLESGFEFNDRRFDSLSAIAREITGTRWNGFLFFGLKCV